MSVSSAYVIPGFQESVTEDTAFDNRMGELGQADREPAARLITEAYGIFRGPWWLAAAMNGILSVPTPVSRRGPLTPQLYC